jgi:hypothetical protein
MTDARPQLDPEIGRWTTMLRRHHGHHLAAPRGASTRRADVAGMTRNDADQGAIISASSSYNAFR